MPNILTILVSVLFATALSACASGSKSLPGSEQVRFTGGDDDVVLAGELSFPAGTGIFPAAVLVTGSGPQDRNETIGRLTPFLTLAEVLNDNGVAVLRHDDRGYAKSKGDYSTATVDDFAADTAAASAFLAADSRISSECLIVIGHSEGGTIAPVAATSVRPAAMILIAATAIPMPDIVRDQQKRLAFPERDPAEVDRVMDAVYAILRDETTVSKKRELLETTLTEAGIEADEREQYLDFFLSPWWLRYMDFVPADYLKALDMPVLAIYGEKDMQVRPEHNADLMRAYLTAPGSRVVTLAQRNHLFQFADTGMPDEYFTIDAPVFDSLLTETIAGWLRDVLPEDCY